MCSHGDCVGEFYSCRSSVAPCGATSSTADDSPHDIGPHDAEDFRAV